MEKKDKVEQGKKNRRKGGEFELKVRKDLESKGWIISKWMNQVEFGEFVCKNHGKNCKSYAVGIAEDANKGKDINGFEQCVHKEGKLIPARRKYNPFSKALSIGTGFPDFIAFKSVNKFGYFTDFRKVPPENLIVFEAIGVEAKSNGYLDKEEKEKCKWLLDNNIFSKIFIVSKGEKRGEIIYNEFKE